MINKENCEANISAKELESDMQSKIRMQIVCFKDRCPLKGSAYSVIGTDLDPEEASLKAYLLIEEAINYRCIGDKEPKCFISEGDDL